MSYHDSTPLSVALCRSSMDGAVLLQPLQAAPTPTLAAFNLKNLARIVKPGQRYRIIVRYKKPSLPLFGRRLLAAAPIRPPRRPLSFRLSTTLIPIVILLGAITLMAQMGVTYQAFTDIQHFNRSSLFQASPLTTTTAFRSEIASEAVPQLDLFAKRSGSNEKFVREAAMAYRKIAEVQGYGRLSNRGDVPSAAVNLKKAVSILDGVAKADAQSSKELAISLQRLANVLSLAGMNEQARASAQRSIAILSKLKGNTYDLELSAAWSELSSIEERTGRKQESLAAARRAIEVSTGLPGDRREYLAQAYQRLSAAISSAQGPTQEALNAAQTAVNLYGSAGQTCGDGVDCRAAYFTAIESLGQIHSEAGRHDEVLKLVVDSEIEIRQMVSRDPNNHLLLRQLRHLQYMAGLALQGTHRIPEALSKYQESINTGVQMTATSLNTDATCNLIQARVRYASLLALKTPKEAESEWNEARRLIQLTSSAGNSMCLQVGDLPNLERSDKAQIRVPIALSKPPTRGGMGGF